jgi:predicted nuclease of predicted toxin-antitoxin system
MIFILDENFPRSAIALLETEGHSAKSILDFVSSGTSDFSLFEEVQRQNAILLTTDKDFFHTIPLLFTSQIVRRF